MVQYLPEIAHINDLAAGGAEVLVFVGHVHIVRFNSIAGCPAWCD
jgi:hypothetical protein